MEKIRSAMNQGAKFSEDRNHRYALWRIWNETKPLVMFIGLNPSTANEVKADPTINRVIRFTYDWGYGGFYMMNLFSFVTAYPQHLKVLEDAENDRWLEEISLKCEMIVFAWGAFGEAKKRLVIRERADAIKARFPGSYCIEKTKKGSPGHPLMLPARLKPKLFFTAPNTDKLWKKEV